MQKGGRRMEREGSETAGWREVPGLRKRGREGRRKRDRVAKKEGKERGSEAGRRKEERVGSLNETEE